MMKIIPALSLPIYEELIPRCRSIYKYFLTVSFIFGLKAA